MLRRFAMVLLASYAMTVAVVIAGYAVSIFLVNDRVADSIWTGWPTVAVWLASFLVCWKFLKPR